MFQKKHGWKTKKRNKSMHWTILTALLYKLFTQFQNLLKILKAGNMRIERKLHFQHCSFSVICVHLDVSKPDYFSSATKSGFQTRLYLYTRTLSHSPHHNSSHSFRAQTEHTTTDFRFFMKKGVSCVLKCCGKTIERSVPTYRKSEKGHCPFTILEKKLN